MKKNKYKKIYLYLKAMFISCYFLFFIILVIVVLNLCDKKINSSEFEIYLKPAAVCLKTKTAKYYFEPNRQKLIKTFNYIKAHPGILPAPFNNILISNDLVCSFYKNIF